MGKSSSKLKKKDRSQSVTWSFRFPSISSLGGRRKMLAVPTTTQVPTGPHMDINIWLERLELTEYSQIFDTFNGVEDLLNYSEADIKELGVKNSAHRARISSSLHVLKAKCEKGARKAAKAALRHSVAVDSSRIVPDSTESDWLAVTHVIQSKSLCNISLYRMGTPEPLGDAGSLRKALEWELSLDSRDLRSHAWYHGAIPRIRAEEIVRQQGDFLVRDCTSQPGNFVLSCFSAGVPLHFVIKKVVIQPDTVYERVQYQFEDDPFDTVPDLITFYVGSGKPISSASQARIKHPCNRLYPLSFYASKYGLQQQLSTSASASPLISPGLASRSGSQHSFHSPSHSPPRSKKDLPPRLPGKKQRSHSLAPLQANGRSHGQLAAMSRSSVDDRSWSADGVISEPISRSSGADSTTTLVNKFSTQSLPRPNSQKFTIATSQSSGTSTVPRNSKITRVTSDPTLSPSMERRGFPELVQVDGEIAPPPKPSLRPSMVRSGSKDCQIPDSDLDTPLNHYSVTINHNTFHKVMSYHTSGSDSGNGSGDSAQSSAAGDVSDSAAPCMFLQQRISGVIIKNARYASIPNSSSTTTLKAEEYDSAFEQSLLEGAIRQFDIPSCFDLENFHTLLLPIGENKPLDATALKGVRKMLQETGSRVIANHLTRVDLELTVGGDKELPWKSDIPLFVNSGIELCVLPFCQQVRQDLIERTICLKLLVAITILTCTADSERAEFLNKWIQVAIDTKTALGNLYGFNAIMMGLCIPQVQRLVTTWHILRQKFTDSAFNFEAKLRPTLKKMNECENPQAPNTTIPHLLPYMVLQERSKEEILRAGMIPSSVESSVYSSWESSASDFGLKILNSHLSASRDFTSGLPMYRRNAQIVLGDSKIDDLILDIFKTEFHLKFIWGSRGSTSGSDERHAKFEQLLTVMSEKCEPSVHENPPSPAPQPPASYNPAIGTSV